MAVEYQKRNRDITIDSCRVIGTFLVMLAHVAIPTSISDFRSFDVILLVILSGVCFRIKSNYRNYIWKRIKKLVFPTWTLLIILFGCTGIACLALNRQQIYSFSQIWKSFLFLQGSIGYIWIVRVYISIAIIVPCLYRITNYYNIFSYLLINLFFIAIVLFMPVSKVVGYYIYESFVYSVICLLGTKINSVEQRYNHMFIIFSTLIAFLVFVVTVFIDGFHPNTCKYPPRTQYVFYGIFISLLVYIIMKNLKLNLLPNIIKIKLSYLSSKSFLLYLVHIFILSLMNIIINITDLSIHWSIYYALLLIISISVVIVIDKSLSFISCRMKTNNN